MKPFVITVSVGLLGCIVALAMATAQTVRLHPNDSDGDAHYRDKVARELTADEEAKVPQAKVAKGPREDESIWFQAWVASAEGGKTGFECSTNADTCLADFKNRFRERKTP